MTWTTHKALTIGKVREKVSPAMLRHGMRERRWKKPDIAAAAREVREPGRRRKRAFREQRDSRPG
jgi:hypothetical protein